MRRSPSPLSGRATHLGPGLALLGITAAALLARVWALGWRIAHQDEGRVASWTLYYLRTGNWEYRPIIHGPFLPHVNRLIAFPLLGQNDFSARLIVALVGGLLPLAAWLFRDRLRDAEVVALGVFLAANPVLLYYSRFMRNDVLLAAFAFAAVGFFVRAVDTRRPGYLYAGTAAFALGFATKELALVYPVYWLGAAGLLADHRIAIDRDREENWLAWIRARTITPVRNADAGRALSVAGPLAIAVVEFFAIVVFFYAPRSATLDTVGLWELPAHPLALPDVVHEAVFGSWNEFVDTWADSASGHSYLDYFDAFWAVLDAGASVLLVLAVVGFVYDRYAGDGPRDLVAFASYWGFASLLTYPVIADNAFPWEMVHVVVPLAVPAAVGLGLLYRRGAEAVASDDRIGVAAAGVLLLLVFGQMGATAYATSFENPQSPDNELVQYAQPAGHMQPTLAEIRRIAAANDDGPDVAFYGEVKRNDRSDPYDDEYILYQTTEEWEAGEDPPEGWFGRLPLPWYLEAYDANVTSTTNASAFADDPPPVVVALERGALDNPHNTAEDVELHLDGYQRRGYQQYLWGREMVFFVRNDTAAAS